MPLSIKEREIGKNYEAFERLLPSLLNTAAGKYALMRDKELVGIFGSASEAQLAGCDRFDDNRFSVQKVAQSPVSLGFFSYARHYGGA